MLSSIRKVMIVRDRLRESWLRLLHTVRLRQWTRRLRRICYARFQSLWHSLCQPPRLLNQLWRELPAITARVISVVVLVLLGTVACILVPEIFHPPMILDDISVPKTFAENGYTATVASERLRAAIDSIVAEGEQQLRGFTFATSQQDFASKQGLPAFKWISA
jgi:hypothetical protein